MAANSKKLLVADDSLTIQKVIRLALSNEGYEIQTVSDGNDAIQQISLFRPNVVLIDVSLPGKTAFEVKKAINEQGDFAEVRFILMSSAFEKVDESLAAQVEFHGRLTKPFDPGHLRQILSEVLAQVAAKRMEATTFLTRPAPEKPAFAPPSAVDKTVPSISLLTPDEETLLNGSGHDNLSDDLIAPIRPHDEMPITPPTAPPIGAEDIGSLWEPKGPANDPFTPPPTPPGSAPISVEPPMDHSLDIPINEDGTSDSDIKHLTEKTIRMSGLVDDFQQWSVNEGARKPPQAPLAPPPPAPGLEIDPPFSTIGDRTLADFQKKEPTVRPFGELADLGGTSFRLDAPLDRLPDGLPNFNREDSTTLPPPPPSSYFNSTDSTVEITQPTREYPSFQPPPEASAHGGSDSSVLPISTDQMEMIIRKQLEETFQRMAKQLLPDIAERVIKAEISKMLNER